MNMLKPIAVVLLSSLIAVNSFAVEQPQKAAQPQTKAQPAAQQDKNLVAFNRNVSIKLVQRGIGKDGDTEYLISTYEIENKSKKKIQAIHWVTGYTLNNQVFLSQPMPVNFNKDTPLKAKAKETINVYAPLHEMNEEVRNVFLNPELPIGALIGAQLIQFSDGKKIEVK